jgi:hypothetical protein
MLVIYVWDEALKKHRKADLADLSRSATAPTKPVVNRSIEPRRLRQAARKLLRKRLKHGPVPGAEVERAAARAAKRAVSNRAGGPE